MLHFSPLVTLLGMILLLLAWKNGSAYTKQYIYGERRSFMLADLPMAFGLGVLGVFAFDICRISLAIIRSY